MASQVTVLMAAGATRDSHAAGRFLFLTTIGNHGLLPLLFTPAEYPIKARALWCSSPGTLSCNWRRRAAGKS